MSVDMIITGGKQRFTAVLIIMLLSCTRSFSGQRGLELSSPDFSSGGWMPREYSGEGRDKSPELVWRGAPRTTESLALIVKDPDAPAGDWVHWVIYNIPARKGGLGEGVHPEEVLSDGSIQGLNSWGKTGYGGPMPPSGPAHRYYFRLY
ncbi:MAG: YbhB/YbcL family Raf kinase inhibitor-like protein, partial [Candidatus Omnitrophica bacterium]|nr:YbhB/YbcL family Raf kinase inhibitor-like protein [Candidatus Omnitrophota bacterium]